MQSGYACNSPPLCLNTLLTYCLTPAAAFPQTQLASQVSTAQKCTTLGPRSFSSAFSSDPLQVGQGWGGPGSKGEARCPGAIQGSQKWPDKAQTQLATERICPSKIHFVIQMNLHFLTKTGNICKTTRIKLENKLPLCTKVNTHRKATIAYLKKKRKCSFMFDI